MVQNLFRHIGQEFGQSCIILSDVIFGNITSKIPLKLNIFLIFVILIFSTFFNYKKYFGGCFEFTSYNDWYGWQNFASSVLVFLFLNNINLLHIPSVVNKVLSYIAKLSLGIYLASWIADDWYYSRLLTKIPVMIFRLDYFPVSIGFVFLLSLLLASVGDAIQTFIMNFWRKFHLNENKRR